MGFVVFPDFTPKLFNFMSCWRFIHINLFLSKFSVELFGILFKDPTLAEVFVPLFKSYPLCFCLNALF